MIKNESKVNRCVTPFTVYYLSVKTSDLVFQSLPLFLIIIHETDSVQAASAERYLLLLDISLLIAACNSSACSVLSGSRPFSVSFIASRRLVVMK